MTRPTVCLTGRDYFNWALDEDMRLTRDAIAELVEFTTLDQCAVVFAFWPEALLQIPRHRLHQKRIICQMPTAPLRWLRQPGAAESLARVGCWISVSTQAQRQFASIGMTSVYIPYRVDPAVFRPLPPDDPELVALRQQWNIPTDRYLIGNFHRDTEGADLTSPKLVKGPDVFLEIVRALSQQGLPIHVLLAGPRRCWLRQQLHAAGIPFTFVGQHVAPGQDDVAVNVLPRPTLNLLYNMLDLCLVSSREEGGPHSIMEAALCRCKVVSSRVGVAEDILAAACLYDSPIQAIDIIARDIANAPLAATLEPQYQRVLDNHAPAATTELYRSLFARLDTIPIFLSPAPAPQTSASIARRWSLAGITQRARQEYPLTRFAVGRILHRFQLKSEQRLTISLIHTFKKPPWGGGNQFMLALRNALRQRGHRVVDNRVHASVDAYLINSVHFDQRLLREIMQQRRARHVTVVQRIDGPIALIRGYDQGLDAQCFAMNEHFATATVIQSAWTLQRFTEMGYRPVRPTIVHNAVDPALFHRRGRITYEPGRKLRLISTSWSDNPRKGGAIYQWLDQHLDWSRFEYTFVGNVSATFEHIRHIPPVTSQELAHILRQHDIYITASRNDPCSNALLEALTCGLPALYLHDGGHPELVGYGGLPFTDTTDILAQLDTLVDHYPMVQNLIAVPTMPDVAATYLALLRGAPW